MIIIIIMKLTMKMIMTKMIIIILEIYKQLMEKMENQILSLMMEGQMVDNNRKKKKNYKWENGTSQLFKEKIILISNYITIPYFHKKLN